jgi:hypothetical protein
MGKACKCLWGKGLVLGGHRWPKFLRHTLFAGVGRFDAEGDGGISHGCTRVDTDGVGHGAHSFCRGGSRPLCAHTYM